VQRNRTQVSILAPKTRSRARQLEWKPADIVDLRLGFHLAKDKSDERVVSEPYRAPNALE